MLQNTPKHILLLVSSDDYRKVVDLAIEMQTDWNVVAAKSIEEGLAIAAESEFDVVLLDSVFVEADLEQLLDRYPPPIVPVIAFVEGRTVDCDSLIEQGAVGVISKMDNLLHLSDRISEVLQW